MTRIANFGCGFDIKEDNGEIEWENIDSTPVQPKIKRWDMTQNPPDEFVEAFDGGLLNHVLCTMNDNLVHKALINIYRTLKLGSKLTVIDMNILKVFKSYQEGRIHDIPIEEGSLDDRLCLAISGYGTRKSLYTPLRICKVLVEAGFSSVTLLSESEYDTRPNESLIVEAIK